MSSELLGAAQNVLKGNLGGAWDINKGYADAYTDLGIARRFGAAAAAYSLRDIGAMNGSVVRVRREPEDTTDAIDDEERFSANQVQSGALEDWVNGKLESTLPADVATAAAAYSLRKVKATYGGDAVRIRRSSDDIEVNVAFDSDNKVSASSAITNIAEQGGESGQTTDTTLGDFISGTDAFVHTWYDQAGSNDATQATAGNQPKIAESGALLADGLKFNGNSDNFTITNGVSGRSIFAVTNQNIDTTSGGLTGYGQDGISSLLGTTATDSYIFISNNNSAFNSYAISIDGASSDSGQYASNGKTLSSAGGNLGTYGDIPSDTNSLLSIIYGSGDPANAWTRLGSGITSNIFMQGSMSEVILYTSDQSANRFKIESNINNYYDLYNDANDMATDWSDDPTAPYGSAFTSNGKDGYTIDYSAGVANTRARWQFANNVPSGDVIYYSFNASITSGTPAVILKQSNGTSNANSSSVAITSGFNSGSITTNAEAVYFAIGDSEGTQGFTISNFKVSRIARNGFVETWYDQSGNGNDAVQASAGNQPAIVQNGGLVTDGIRFETDNELETGGNITASTITGFVVANLKGTNANSLYSLGSDSSGAPSVLFGNPSLAYVINGGTALSGGTAPTFANTLFTQLFISGGTSKSFIDGSQIASGDAGSNTASSGKITIGNLASASPNRYANIAMNELIVFTSDKSTDQDEIEEDISRNYNITLS